VVENKAVKESNVGVAKPREKDVLVKRCLFADEVGVGASFEFVEGFHG
jgi:hypothetical protein